MRDPLQRSRSSGSPAGLPWSDGGRDPPAGLRLVAGSSNHNPVRLYFLSSAGSPRGCSFDDRVTRFCASSTSRAARTLPSARGGGRRLERVPAHRFLTRGRRENEDGGDRLRLSALLRSAVPRITHSLRSEREEEGETEVGVWGGGDDEKMRNSTDKLFLYRLTLPNILSRIST